MDNDKISINLTGEIESPKEELEDMVTHILEEARMVLPGIQALLGFQLIAVFNQAFKSNLSTTEQYLHLAAIFFSLNSICLLMTPAAVHRMSEPLNISEDFAALAGKLVASGMVPLLLSFCLDFYVVSNLVSESRPFSLVGTAVVATIFLYFWFAMPLLRKEKQGFFKPRK